MRKIWTLAALTLLAGCDQRAPGNLSSQENTAAERSPAAIRAAEAGDEADANRLADNAAAPVSAPPQMGRCHDDECAWFRTESRSVVRREASGILYRLSVLGGTAPDEENAQVRWARAPHEVFVFCSRRLPAVILPDNGVLQVDVLDFVTGPTGPYESSANLYVDICHPGEDWASEGFAQRHGYQVQDPEREIRLTRPDNIFGALP